MKILWDAEDVRPGRIVGKPLRGERWMIGYDSTVATDADGPRWCLVSLSDGMVSYRYTRAEIAERLTRNEEMPVELFHPTGIQNDKG